MLYSNHDHVYDGDDDYDDRLNLKCYKIPAPVHSILLMIYCNTIEYVQCSVLSVNYYVCVSGDLF